MLGNLGCTDYNMFRQGIGRTQPAGKCADGRSADLGEWKPERDERRLHMEGKGWLREHTNMLSFFVRTADLFLIIGSALVVYLAYRPERAVPQLYMTGVGLAALLVLLIFPATGVYQSWRGGGLVSEIRRITVAWAAVIALLIVFAFLSKTSVQYSRVWLGVWGLSAWALLVAYHAGLRLGSRWIRERGFNVRRIAIVGAGNLGRSVARQIQESPWTGYKVVGFYDDNPALHGQRLDGIRVRGAPCRLPRLMNRQFVDEVWLALPLRAEQRVKDILHEFRHSTATVRFVPDIFGFQLLNHSFSEVAGVPVLDLNASPMGGINRVMKAVEDRILSAVILLLTSPLLLLIALGVKLSSPGSVFFRQERVSWNGKPFMMLKFRSMPVDAEDSSGPVWTRKGENRATPFGAFLRRTSLDELPQFINVLKGDMSIVGPRPERPVFVERFKDEIPNYMKKHLVKAGITGWAQVNGWRGDTDLRKRIEFDMQYIENWSLWLDIKILLLTLVRGFVHKNAY